MATTTEAEVSGYAKGAKYERVAKEELEKDGWLVVRSAGSKGPFDLWAMKVRLIQVKATNDPRAWTAEIEDLAEYLLGGPGVSRELWVWNSGCGWEKHTVEDGE